jgi:hypothetical protein
MKHLIIGAITAVVLTIGATMVYAASCGCPVGSGCGCNCGCGC